MPEEKSSRPPSRRRRAFRFCRKLALLLVLLLIGGLVYLNQIGLPRFAKEPLLKRLEARGLDAEFSRLRWGWLEGLVAENLVLRRQSAEGGPEFRSAEARVRVRLPQLLRGDLRVDSVGVRGGQFSWGLPGANEWQTLRLEDIEAEIALGENEMLELRRFDSRFHGLRLELDGTFAHPQALVRPVGTNGPPRDVTLLNTTLTRVADYLTNFQFSAEPALKLQFHADATDWRALQASLNVHLPRTRTRWGEAEEFQMRAVVEPVSETNHEPSCAITFTARTLETPWGRVEGWQAQTHTVPVVQLPMNSSNSVSASFARATTRWGTLEAGRVQLSVRALDEDRPQELDFSADLAARRLVSPQATAQELSWRAEGTLNRTNGLPLRGSHHLTIGSLVASNLTARAIQLRLTQEPVLPDAPVGGEDWGFWRFLAPYAFDFDVAAEVVSARGVEVASVAGNGRWAAPNLHLREVRARLYDGEARVSANIDVPSREIQAAAEVAFDFHRLDPVFTERFRNWFAPYQWAGVPRATVTGRAQWPDWRDLTPDWRGDVVPSIGISGSFHVSEPRYQGIPGLEAFSDFHFTNSVWNLPNLTLVRPEGRVLATYDGDERTKDYVWQLRAEVDPHALKPLFKEGQLKIFNSFTNHATPLVEGTIWGRWRAHERIGFRARVTAPGLEVRGERTDRATATVEYTNRFLTLLDVEIQQSNRVGRAGSLGLDLPGRRMYFTNVDSALPPQSVARTIGPVTARAVAPYVFAEPPRILVNGVLGLDDHEPTELDFSVAGGPFHWWRFHLDTVQATLLWRSNRLELTNVIASFYGGDAAGAGTFHFFEGDRPTEFRFNTSTTNAQLQPLVRDVFFKTNGLEGALSGTLEVTAGRADSLDTWQGSGGLQLRDGLIWDIPIFGIFSPVFNAISPGLGQSRAEEAVATFTLINGTIISRDLEVRAPQLSMGYQGSVDFLGQVEARMQARLLKDFGALGPLISTVLWPLTKIFEYRLSGTLSEPVAEPIHIPKFLFMALEPFKALQGVLKGGSPTPTPPPPPP